MAVYQAWSGHARHALIADVHTLWPDPDADELTEQTLEEIYAYPATLDRPWVQVNFVTSLDGPGTSGCSACSATSPT
jgi:hypothetical protein